ncbi:MAG TPA: M20/M25/M40 family metallo-hydrolase [Candidatus Limnocylindrales bacterium]|nr:M20/M25/M40 family metallo-hydrolase [Candidatus Limnocylindrales bacterium]
MKLLHICCILVMMATLSARATDNPVEKMAQNAACARGLDWIDRNTEWVTSEQVRLTEIPAPEFAEHSRAEYLKHIFEVAGLVTRIDKTGNVIGEWPGADRNSVVLVAAHLDTVFSPGTDVNVKRDGDQLEAPGISDNGAGLAAIAGLARALAESRVRVAKTIAIVGDVGEEGEGNLRGIRALIESYGSRLAAVIAVDGPSIEHITTQGIASRRFEISITGPGGHSWSDFGAPNPITALSRGIVQFSSIHLPDHPRSSFNFGIIEGGTSVNSIPAQAAVKVDLRSEEESELARLESALRDAMQSGMRQEISANAALNDALQINFRSLGSRPAGKLPDGSALLDTIRNVDRYLGNRSRIERSSTDANIPLSMGIPAVALGGGGRGGGSHTLSEWYDATGRALGLKRLYLAVLALAGLQQ